MDSKDSQKIIKITADSYMKRDFRTINLISQYGIKLKKRKMKMIRAIYITKNIKHI